MKVFSQYINEKCDTADVNQGNSLLHTGVSNHLTPIGNIVTNVKNLFATRLSVVASVAEDGVSIKLNSSYFTDPKEINKVLYNYEIMRGTCLASYIMSQGLDLIKTVNLGQFYVVYFCPSDIKTAMPGVEPNQAALPCKEMLDYNLDEAEMIMLKEDAEEELDASCTCHVNAWNTYARAELFRIKGNMQAASQTILAAANMAKNDNSLCKMTARMLSGAGMWQVLWQFTETLGEEQKSLHRIRFYRALAAEKLGMLETAEEILYADGGLEIPDIQEGEISITNLWFDIEEKKAKRDGKPFDRNTARPPKVFDFRMFVAD